MKQAGDKGQDSDILSSLVINSVTRTLQTHQLFSRIIFVYIFLRWRLFIHSNFPMNTFAFCQFF
jgi:hypothetical protein